MTEDQTNDPYPNAGRASGYTDDAAQPVGENVVNIVTGIVTAAQTKWVLENAKITAQLKDASTRLDDTYKTQEQRFDYMLKQMAAFLEKEDKRHDLLAEKERADEAVLASVALGLDQLTSLVQQVVTMWREANARLGKIEKAVIVLKKGQTASDKQLTSVTKLLTADIAELRIQIGALGTITEETSRLTEETNRLTAETNRLTEEHNRATAEQVAIQQRVVDLETRLARLEAGGG